MADAETVNKCAIVFTNRRCSPRRALSRLLALGAMILVPCLALAQESRWESDWEVASGFALSVDTDGYAFPSSIAFVPHPGPGPKDPLYFVTELRGTVKVVSNDRSIHTFAKDFFDLEPMQALEESPRLPELGMAGIALDEEHGFVFVSFSYHDETGQIRNNVVRFESEPGTFSSRATGQVAFTDIFSDQPGDDSHMIGPLAVHQGHLYVCVGDARVPALSQDLDSTDGKILRMTLDGDPVTDNPFYLDGSRKKPRNYVWAYGFRNPFGLKIVKSKFFVSDVGPGVDRFLAAKEGRNYYYDGSDWSISSHADVVFTPSTSPVQVEYHPTDKGPFPGEFRGKFYVATSGHQREPGPSSHGDKAVLIIDYDFGNDRVIGRPHHLLKYRGNRGVMPVGIALGPDGLYMVSLSRERSRKHSVIKISYDPENPHPFEIGRAEELMQSYGCRGCHRDDPLLPFPSIDQKTLVPRLLARLRSRAYIEESIKLDEVTEEPMNSFREARQEVRETEGIEKVRLWLRYHLLEPRFDHPRAIMPNLRMKKEHANLIADYLTEAPVEVSIFQPVKDWIADWIPVPRQRHLMLFLGIGIVMGSFGSACLLAIATWWRGRRAGGGAIARS